MQNSEIEKFDNWNKLKKELQELRQNSKLYVRNREIWYINMGKNLGFESNGKGNLFKRPVLILKIVGSMLFVVSMTTKGKNSKFYYKLDNKYFGKESYITLSQVKIIDKKRLIEQIGQIDIKDFLEIKNRLKQILF